MGISLGEVYTKLSLTQAKTVREILDEIYDEKGILPEQRSRPFDFSWSAVACHIETLVNKEYAVRRRRGQTQEDVAQHKRPMPEYLLTPGGYDRRAEYERVPSRKDLLPESPTRDIGLAARL